MFVSRRQRGRDRYLRWKVVALAAAAALIFVGVRFELAWPIWAAIGVLAAGWLLRFAAGKRRVPDGSDAADEP